MRGNTPPPQYITDSVRRPVRQFISAGEAGETVPDASVFEKVFLSLLQGEYSDVTMESGDFPYWFYVTMTNACDQDILFNVAFNLLSGPAVINKEQNIVYKIRAGQTFAQSVPFPVDFSKPELDDVLTVSWTIHRSDDQTILDQGTAKIVVLPKTRYCANLINFDGTPVASEFLFASLTAWSQSADNNPAGKIHRSGAVRKAIPAGNLLGACGPGARLARRVGRSAGSRAAHRGVNPKSLDLPAVRLASGLVHSAARRKGAASTSAAGLDDHGQPLASRQHGAGKYAHLRKERAANDRAIAAISGTDPGFAQKPENKGTLA